MRVIWLSSLLTIFLVILAATFWAWPLTTRLGSYGTPPQCAELDVSYSGHGFSYSVGRPLFIEVQFVMQPGSSADLEVHYRANGFSLRETLEPLTNQSSITTIEHIGIVGTNGQLVYTRPKDVGLMITLSNMTFKGDEAALLQYTVSANNSSLHATFLVPVPDYCFDPLFLTVGYFPYLGTLPSPINQLNGDPQPIALVLYLVAAFLVGGCVHFLLRFRYSYP